MKPAFAFAAVALFFAAGVGVGVIAGGADDTTTPLAQTIQQAQLAPVVRPTPPRPASPT